MRLRLALAVGLFVSVARADAEWVPLLAEGEVAVLAGEVSGSSAKRNLEYLARLHRMRGSKQYRQAAEFIVGQLQAYGLSDAEILEFPADGKTFYGTQKARPAWDAEFAELWEVEAVEDGWRRVARLASWETMPVSLAQDSESADVTAELVAVGAGTAESDYAGKEVAGRIVLTSSQPGAAAKLAVAKYGAVGILSYAQNQVTAWWKEDENLVRWGHLGSFNEFDSFGFMVSLKQARAFEARLAAGEQIQLHARVRAGRHPGAYSIVTATIPGADPRLKNQEIAFSCHLDHQRPGANDNASGCVAILEAARTLAGLINANRIPRPARTIRFIWPPEIEGTSALLNGRPDIAARIKAVIHMDMVGGGPVTKAVFRVSRPPLSLPSFVGDVGQAFGALVNSQSERFASGATVPYPLVDPEGGKEALLAVMEGYSAGSDHMVYGDSFFAIPYIYLHDWPDRYIHTNFDSVANIDPTKLERAAFIGAASALYLAALDAVAVPALWNWVSQQILRRSAVLLERRGQVGASDAATMTRAFWRAERAAWEAVAEFATVPAATQAAASEFFSTLSQLTALPAPKERPPRGPVYRRNPNIKGMMSVFGYDYLADHYGEDRTVALALLKHQGPWGGGGDYAYEALNFVDGERSVSQIRDLLSAQFGPVPVELVAEYLAALAEIDVIRATP